MHVIQCLQHIYKYNYCVCANYTCIRVLYLYDTIIYIYTHMFSHDINMKKCILFISRRMLVWLTSRPETTAFTVSFVVGTVGTPCSMPYVCWWNHPFSIWWFPHPGEIAIAVGEVPFSVGESSELAISTSQILMLFVKCSRFLVPIFRHELPKTTGHSFHFHVMTSSQGQQEGCHPVTRSGGRGRMTSGFWIGVWGMVQSF